MNTTTKQKTETLKTASAALPTRPQQGNVALVDNKLAERGISLEQWSVLKKVIYPEATDDDVVLLAWDYCKARGMDVMKKPVNIVPLWNSKQNKMVDTLWPSINELRITAHRSQKYAGKEPPKFGDNMTETFTATYKKKEAGIEREEKKTFQVTYPEWCEVVVYKIVGNERCAFVERVYWKEAFSRTGGADGAPNTQWQKRPHGQLAKCAEAASLRCAFPEEAGGMYIEEEAFMHDVTPTQVKQPRTRDAEPLNAALDEEVIQEFNWQNEGNLILKDVQEAESKELAQAILKDHIQTINKMVVIDEARVLLDEIYAAAKKEEGE